VARRRKTDLTHPYAKFEDTKLWKILNKGIADLVTNEDLKELTDREHVVGYLCKVLSRGMNKSSLR
jgi:hypothetical protein